MNRNWKFGLAVFAACAGPWIVGCGTGEYNARLQVSLTDSGRKAASDSLQKLLHTTSTPVIDAAGQPVGVTLQLPAVLDKDTKSLAATEGRAQPPFVKIPGLGYAMERLLDDPSGQFAPVYCYLAAAPKADQPADAVLADVLKQVAVVFPPAAWQDVQLNSPTGNVAVKLLSVSGQQDFDNAQSGGAVVKLDGRMDLYFYDGPTHLVFVGFRAPTAQADKYKFFDAGRAALGTIQAAAAAPPADAGQPAPAPAADPAAPAAGT